MRPGRIKHVQIRELSIPDSYEITPIVRGDDRGVFLEWYRHDALEAAVGHSLDLRQANTSVSKSGVVRGIHYADVPRGQAKYVTATYGAVLDFVVDIRVGSPTFGKWDSVLLDTVDRRAIYLSEGLGHAFVALTDDATVSYLVSDTYNAPREHGINPADPDIGLDFSDVPAEILLSPKDTAAPSLADAAQQGLLPRWDDMRRFYDSLNSKEN
jgi:dTDP-4-dehydrorhamnose 3,5-epimerase